MASNKMPEHGKNHNGDEIREARAVPSDSFYNSYIPGSDSGSVNVSDENRNIDSREAESDNMQSTQRGSQFAARVSALPLVRCSVAAYERLRDVPFVAVPLVLMECALGLGILPFQILAVPLSGMCPAPLRAADWALCRGLDVVETVCPCIAGSSDQVPANGVNQLMNYVCSCPRAVHKTISSFYQWQMRYIAHR
ncbi:Protein of unknown function [Gryllus bimaculatus]|nr:Protein of unknown function [Gryllus bimaculatus]